jgi:aminomethyltransferase
VSDDLERTPLTALHEDDGAKLAPFAGWAMPVSFSGTLTEHHAVRDDVGVFDVSHLGTVWVEGPDAQAVVAASFTNDPARLADGGSQYTLCCDADGGIVDDLIVYRLAAERWVTVPNAANTAEVVATLRAAAEDRDAQVRDVGHDWAVLAVQGRRWADALDAAGVVDGVVPREVPYLEARETTIGGAAGVLCRTGYTGEPGCELLVAADAAPTVWSALRGAGVTACGLGARDTLRLEAGYPLHGNDLSRDVTPYEARSGWAVKLDRGDFRGRDALVAAKQAGPSRRLWGLLAPGRRPLRAGATVRRGDTEVGTTTSGSASPVLQRGIAMALLADPLGPGDTVTVDLRGTDVEVEVVKPPFVTTDPRA